VNPAPRARRRGGSRPGCQARPAFRAAQSGAAKPRPPGTGRAAAVGFGDVPLSSRASGAVGVGLDRPLDANVRNRLHGTACDRVPDDADAHRRMASQRPGPPGIHADVAGESSGLHPGGDHRSDRATRPSHGRADPDTGPSSGPQQRPAAVPRVSLPARETRGRSRHELIFPRRVPGHRMDPLPANTPTPGPNSTPSARCLAPAHSRWLDARARELATVPTTPVLRNRLA
jgi:hypothetical protein